MLLLGLYNLVLFAVRRENPSSLYLGLLCLLIALRTGMVGERFATLVAPVAFRMFLREVFPREFSRPMVLGFSVAFGALALAVMVTPVSIFSHTMAVAQAGTVLALVFGAAGLLMAIRH